jgi:predicted short-subunit dehydrogenase-like oxidoreductase (DUF2520 family)
MKIVLIGSGNVAWHLGSALKQAGYLIVQVVARNLDAGAELSMMLQCPLVDTEHIDSSADLYIFAVKDDAIATMAKQLFGKVNPAGTVVHTSGATSIAVLERYFDQVGCIYPMQTFSKKKEIDMKGVPFFVTANLLEIESELRDMVSRISEKVQIINDNQRLSLHVAAVFASNFTNHMLAIAAEILHQQYLDFNLLQPLVVETITKAFQYAPIDGQTGPAVREDREVLEKHLKYLQNNIQYQKVYQAISESIIDLNRKKY